MAKQKDRLPSENGTQVTLTIPNTIYQQVEQTARAAQRPVQDVLVEAVTEAFSSFPVHPGRAAVEREVAAFEAMHAQLVKQYLGRVVAIYEGQVIDHDDNEEPLVRRIDSTYPGKIVLIRRVREKPQSDLIFRSPRFLPDES